MKSLSSPLTAGWRGLFCAALAGALAVPAFGPWNIWALAPLSLLLLLMLLHRQPAKRSAWLGFAYAFGLNLPGLSWIHISMTSFGGIPLPIAMLMVAVLSAYLAIYPALACGLLARFFPQAGAVRTLLALPILWLLADWAMGWVLTGFPWLLFGYSQIDSPLVGYAPVLGVQGITLILWLSVGGIFLTGLRRQPLWLVLPAVLFAGGVWLHQQSWTTEGKPLKFALMQGNIAQATKWDPNNITPTLKRYLGMSHEHPDADIIVWPESAVPALENEMETFLVNIDEVMRENHTGFLTGIQYYDVNKRHYFNSVLGLGNLDAAGTMRYQFGQGNRYYKRHLVPIGEFVPFGNLLRPIAPFFNLPMSSFSEGDATQPNIVAHDHKFATAICYEMAFPGELLADVHADTDYLLTVSNDTWFGTSHGPWQHREISRMRAIEFGKPLIRATNSGVTVAFDSKGRTLGQLPQFTQQTLVVDVAPAQGQTPYNRFGSWPLLIWGGCGLLLAFLLRRPAQPRW